MALGRPRPTFKPKEKKYVKIVREPGKQPRAIVTPITTKWSTTRDPTTREYSKTVTEGEKVDLATGQRESVTPPPIERQAPPSYLTPKELTPSVSLDSGYKRPFESSQLSQREIKEQEQYISYRQGLPVLGNLDPRFKTVVGRMGTQFEASAIPMKAKKLQEKRERIVPPIEVEAERLGIRSEQLTARREDIQQRVDIGDVSPQLQADIQTYNVDVEGYNIATENFQNIQKPLKELNRESTGLYLRSKRAEIVGKARAKEEKRLYENVLGSQKEYEEAKPYEYKKLAYRQIAKSDITQLESFTGRKPKEQTGLQKLGERVSTNYQAWNVAVSQGAIGKGTRFLGTTIEYGTSPFVKAGRKLYTKQQEVLSQGISERQSIPDNTLKGFVYDVGIKAQSKVMGGEKATYQLGKGAIDTIKYEPFKIGVAGLVVAGATAGTTALTTYGATSIAAGSVAKGTFISGTTKGAMFSLGGLYGISLAQQVAAIKEPELRYYRVGQEIPIVATALGTAKGVQYAFRSWAVADPGQAVLRQAKKEPISPIRARTYFKEGDIRYATKGKINIKYEGYQGIHEATVSPKSFYAREFHISTPRVKSVVGKQLQYQFPAAYVQTAKGTQVTRVLGIGKRAYTLKSVTPAGSKKTTVDIALRTGKKYKPYYSYEFETGTPPRMTEYYTRLRTETGKSRYEKLKQRVVKTKTSETVLDPKPGYQTYIRAMKKEYTITKVKTTPGKEAREYLATEPTVTIKDGKVTPEYSKVYVNAIKTRYRIGKETTPKATFRLRQGEVEAKLDASSIIRQTTRVKEQFEIVPTIRKPIRKTFLGKKAHIQSPSLFSKQKNVIQTQQIEIPSYLSAKQPTIRFIEPYPISIQSPFIGYQTVGLLGRFEPKPISIARQTLPITSIEKIQRSEIRPVSKLTQLPDVIQQEKILPIQETISEQQQQQIQTVKYPPTQNIYEYNYFETPPPPPPPPPLFPGGFILPGGIYGAKKSKLRRFKQEKGYQPDVTSLIFGITGKKSKTYKTGVGLRPLIKF